MDFDSLQSLADSYSAEDRAALAELASRFERRQQQEILDLAAVAADVSVDSILNLGLEPEIAPLLMRAFRLQYPNVAPESLVEYSDEGLEGFTRGIKGKYFEVLVEARLNSGESVGELTLGPGQVARIAESPTQEDWDLEFLNKDDGSLVEALQFKATTSMSYVRRALTDNPDIKVAVPKEIDGVANEILQTDISNEQMVEAVQRYVGELSEDTVTDALHQSAEWVFDSVPLIPAVLVAVTEGRSILLGRSSIEQSLQRGGRRLGRSALFSTLGATLVALDAGLLSVPTTSAARIAWARVANGIAMGEFIQWKTEEIKSSTCLPGTSRIRESLRPAQ